LETAKIAEIVWADRCPSDTKPEAGIAWFIPTAVSMGAKIIRDDGIPNSPPPPMAHLVKLIHDMVHEDKC